MGRYVEQHTKVYCLLRTEIRVSRSMFFDCLDFTNPPHLVVKTYAQKCGMGTERCEFRHLDEVVKACPDQTSLRIDVGAYVYATPGHGVTLCRVRRTNEQSYTNPL